MATATSLIVAPPTTGSLDYLGGAILGKTGVPTGNFTVTPNGTYTGTVTFSDLSITGSTISGGTFTPTSLTWNNSATAQTFTYTPPGVGRQVIKVESHPSITRNADLWVTTTS